MSHLFILTYKEGTYLYCEINLFKIKLSQNCICVKLK